jgi:transposase
MPLVIKNLRLWEVKTVRNYIYIGLDKGRYENHALFMDGDGTVIKRLNFETTHQDCMNLIKEVKATARALSIIPMVGFEGKGDHFKPLVSELQSISAQIKPVSPLSVKRYKDMLFTQEKKDDDLDALAIADFLRTRSQQIRELRIASPQASTLKELASLHRDYAKQINRYTNKLMQTLSEYFPEYISKQVFSKVAGKASLELLVNYPRPEELRGLSLTFLTQFLKKHSQGHLSEKKAEEILTLVNSLIGFSFDTTVLGFKVSTLASTLLAFKEQLNKLGKRIAAELRNIPDAALLMSMPASVLLLHPGY